MAMILDAFVGKCVERLAVLVEEEVILVLGVKDELKRLQRRLYRIQSVLKDAERRRIQDAAVNNWLNELKDVMYDADDILDLCRFEGGRWLEDHPSSSISSSSSASPVRCYSHLLSCFTNVQFRHVIGSSIKNLNDRLEEISRDKLILTLESSKPGDMRSGGVNPRQTSPLEEDDVVGEDIQEATDRLAELIVGEEKQKCRVFAIVGMGGIGKTTLAQKLYNDPRIKKNFQERERVWVCISQSFSETDLLREIISSAGGDPGNAQTKAVLLPMLMNVIMGKRLFIVLDDVWRADVWVDLLGNPLRRGPTSCRIVVTTRNKNVAMMMGAEFVHQVEVLSVESGWKMLRNRVFINGEEEEIQSLREIGNQIVDKCKRLPLAIKTIAGVLSAKDRTRREWEKVVGSDAWSMSQLPEELRGALYLSYEDLPSHLKQCFLYLSLFPEDYHYRKSELSALWIAEGFVETHGNSSLEDTAEEYYTELVGRSILSRSNWGMNYCKLHDLLRSLACLLADKECFCGRVERISSSVTSQLRRLCIEDTGDYSVVLTAESIIRHNRLRTLFLLSKRQKVENDLISGLGYLRVLNVQGIELDRVPIGDLIHLRYLNLQGSYVSELPESLGRLTNLQFLNISRCSNLHTLPEGITRLCNLRSLRMGGTPLIYVPKGIGKLQLLNHLEGIVLGDDNSSVAVVGEPQQEVQVQSCDLEDLRNLSQLRFLSILRLEKSSTSMVALQSKSHLKELYLEWTGNTGGQQPYTEEEMGKMVKIEKIFNELTPPSCLESLTLDGFFGRSYPSWMFMLGTFLPHLTDISLWNFTYCPQIPPLGELPQLRNIVISKASAVVTIGPEFMGSTSTAFPKLEFVRFEDMDNWEEWSLGREIEIEIEERAAGGEGIIENRSMVLFPRLQTLILWHCPNLRLLPISSFPALKSLMIFVCPALKVVGSQNVLQQLTLYNREMECLPEWLKQLLQQRLQAEDTNTNSSNFLLFNLGCNDILFGKCLMDGPEWPIIQRIPQVYVDGEKAGELYYTKDPFSYKTTNFSSSQDPNV